MGKPLRDGGAHVMWSLRQRFAQGLTARRVFALSLLVAALAPGPQSGVDFRSGWVAAQGDIAGSYPQRIGPDGVAPSPLMPSPETPPWLSPPCGAAWFAPWAMLPLPLATHLHAVVLAALILACIPTGAKAIDLLVASPFLAWVVHLGQPSALLVPLACALRDRRDIAAGILLGMLATVKVWPLAWIGLLLLRGRKDAAVVALTTVIGLALLYADDGSAWAAWWRTTIEMLQGGTAVLGGLRLSWPLRVAIVAVALVTHYRVDDDTVDAVTPALLAPLLWPHYFVGLVAFGERSRLAWGMLLIWVLLQGAL